MTNKDFFKGRVAVIATKHQKERVIKPILEKELGLICAVPENLDTDLLGTFSGEIERLDDPITTLRKKCLMAIESTGIDIAIANEGSFGPHPTIFFANADDEIIMLYDRKNDIEIIERELSLDTNFNGSEISSEAELVDFANKIGFPAHGIILKRAKTNYIGIIKRSADFEQLIENYKKVMDEKGNAYAETDMRAMLNPTRMRNIEAAAKKLVAKAKSLCPECGTPGLGVVQVVPGLPCENCGFRTKSTLKHICRCQKCGYEREILNPTGKITEDPQYCDMCNP